MKTEQANLFILGFGAGVAAAILLAPRSGAATRALIARRAAEGETLVRQKGAELSDTATQAFERSRKAAQVTASGIADAVAAGRQVLMEDNVMDDKREAVIS